MTNCTQSDSSLVKKVSGMALSCRAYLWQCFARLYFLQGNEACTLCGFTPLIATHHPFTYIAPGANVVLQLLPFLPMIAFTSYNTVTDSGLAVVFSVYNWVIRRSDVLAYIVWVRGCIMGDSLYLICIMLHGVATSLWAMFGMWFAAETRMQVRCAHWQSCGTLSINVFRTGALFR